MKRAIATGLAAAALLGLPAAADSPSPADPDDAAQVARGQAVYAERCASCHGASLEGESAEWRQPKPDGTFPAPPHDETGHTWHHDDFTLFGITRKGTRGFTGQADIPAGMPAFQGVLSDEDIWAVLAFIKSRWPEPVQKRQELITRKAAARGAR